MSDSDPILVACDDVIPTESVATDGGEQLANDIPPVAQVDCSEDGSITSVVRPDGGWEIIIDETTPFGAKIGEFAHKRGMSAENLVLDSIQQFVDDNEEADTNPL